MKKIGKGCAIGETGQENLQKWLCEAEYDNADNNNSEKECGENIIDEFPAFRIALVHFLDEKWYEDGCRNSRSYRDENEVRYSESGIINIECMAGAEGKCQELVANKSQKLGEEGEEAQKIRRFMETDDLPAEHCENLLDHC